MYWIFSILFLIVVLIPDIVRGGILLLSEERAEELAIFILGAITFLIFIQNEKKTTLHKKEKEKNQKKMDQTVKDLIDSYNYIGEVNRKMDILMGVVLGLSDNSILDKNKEREVYESIINATNFLLKAKTTIIRFVDLRNNKTEKEINFQTNGNKAIPNKDLTSMGENINVKKQDEMLIVSSPQKIKNMKVYLIISGYDEEEESKPKNMEILKLFASQSIFLYSYMLKKDKQCECD